MRRAGLARAGDDVHHAFGQFRFLKNLRQPHRREAGGLGGLEHDGVAARERRRDFPRGHQQRKIPRNDLPRDAERLRRFAGKRVFQLVRPARVIKEMRGHERQIHVAAFLDRLAAVHRFEHGQLARLLLDDARDAIKIFAALASRHFAPDLVVGAPRGLHRAVHVRRIRRRRSRSASASVAGLMESKYFPECRRDEFAVDEQLMPRRDDVILGILRRGRVIPFVAEIQAAILQRHDGVSRSWRRRAWRKVCGKRVSVSFS